MLHLVLLGVEASHVACCMFHVAVLHRMLHVVVLHVATCCIACRMGVSSEPAAVGVSVLGVQTLALPLVPDLPPYEPASYEICHRPPQILLNSATVDHK